LTGPDSILLPREATAPGAAPAAVRVNVSLSL